MKYPAPAALNSSCQMSDAGLPTFCSSIDAPSLRRDRPHARAASAAARKIDEPALDVRLEELDRDLLPDVETLEPVDQLPLHGRTDDPHPGPLLGRGGDHPLEPLPD